MASCRGTLRHRHPAAGAPLCLRVKHSRSCQHSGKEFFKKQRKMWYKGGGKIVKGGSFRMSVRLPLRTGSGPRGQDAKLGLPPEGQVHFPAPLIHPRPYTGALGSPHRNANSNVLCFKVTVMHSQTRQEGAHGAELADHTAGPAVTVSRTCSSPNTGRDEVTGSQQM